MMVQDPECIGRDPNVGSDDMRITKVGQVLRHWVRKVQEKPRRGSGPGEAGGARKTEYIWPPGDKFGVCEEIRTGRLANQAVLDRDFRYGISVNKLFDYLAASKPLILAGRPVNNPVEEAHCGLTVPPRNPEALAEAIVQLYHMSPEEREAMGCRGWEYVEEHHDIRKLAERLEQVLLEVLFRPRR